MKVLFIFKSENFLAPIGLCCISASLKADGHETFLCEVNSTDPITSINNITPDLIAASISTGEAKNYFRIFKEIKEQFPEIFTVLGGPHPTFFPDIVDNDFIDAICIGEGDLAIKNLVTAIETDSPIDSVLNIVTKKNLSSFNIGNLIEDLDTLPFPDYSLLYDNTPMGKYPLKNFITSRGCPYDCSYCFNGKYNELYENKGKVVRRHSVDYVIEDIKRVQKKWPLSNVKFYDDIFAYKADDWLEEFAEKYKNIIDLPFFILTRADLLTEDMVKLLKHAGCRTISMSIETANYDIRNALLNRKMTNEQIINAHRLCDKYGIYTFTNCIIGLPQSTIKDDLDSLNLAVKCKVSWAEYLIFHPYPGTELADRLVEQKIYEPNYDEMHTSYMHSSPLKSISKKHNNKLMNLSCLGAVATVSKILRPLIIKLLIHIKHNFIFTTIYFIVKMYIIRKKIYVTKTSFLESLLIFYRSFKQELFRHELNDK